MVDRRSIGDRRKKPTGLFSRYAVFGGRRRTTRRTQDKRRHILVDNYGLRLFIALLFLLALSTLDAYLTLALVKAHHAEEVNPIMALYLERGNSIFLFEKFLFTAIAILILAALNKFFLAKISLALAIVIYLGVVFYELSILHTFLR